MLPLEQQPHYADLKLETQMLYRTIYDEINQCNDIEILKARFFELLGLHFYRKQIGDALIHESIKDSFESRLGQLQSLVDEKSANS